MNLELSYNTSRVQMQLPEYGRNVQEMIEHVAKIEDRPTRNLAAQAIIEVMGQLNPHLRDEDDYRHKLWTHLFIMANFELDVDSPYGIPEEETLKSKPERMVYPKNKIRFGHYGYNTELILKKASQSNPGEEREYLKLQMANFMKKQFLAYASNSVENHLIASQMKELSGGTMILDNPEELIQTNQVIRTMQGIHINNDPSMRKKPNNNSKNKPQSKNNNYKNKPR